MISEDDDWWKQELIPISMPEEFPKETVAPEATTAITVASGDASQSSQAVTTPIGRQAFRTVVRHMTDEELRSPAATKLLLDMLEQAELARDEYRSYVTKYYETDKREAIAQEKLRTNLKLDIYYGVGLSLGGIFVGIAPTLWYKTPPDPFAGNILLCLGFTLLVGSPIVRLFRR